MRPGGVPSRSASGRATKAGNSSVDTSDAAINPDPAVFEAAFVIDDSDDPSRSGTPKPPAPPEKDTTTVETEEKTTNGSEESEKDGEKASAKVSAASPDSKKPTEGSEAPSGLTPEIKQRLRKLEKLEATYPGN